ncbi:hypothetical protein BDP55DRAFT_683196 [Colletotrichum godetiae]|uniref:Uncharacterized protein n=1 Tax=Colletotrichum godetiae TaxID=1209918 RepID=A0AAJ0A862_9PEZI|nr:uncharacterized protein BDP55DRAFT_683196 [Colletotrichum godetiae]KAK1658272.1 hypothetical protein BDP55DRAFT_683196 [Colletotrichum godetiae]
MRKAACLLQRAASLTPACCLTTDLSSVAGLASKPFAIDAESDRLRGEGKRSTASPVTQVEQVAILIAWRGSWSLG